MTRPKTKEYVTFSFKCLVGRDDKLIELMREVNGDRSAFIRKKLQQSLHLPVPTDPRTVDVATLQSELAKAVEKILRSPMSRQVLEVPAVVVQDVNDMGARIPDF